MKPLLREWPLEVLSRDLSQQPFISSFFAELQLLYSFSEEKIKLDSIRIPDETVLWHLSRDVLGAASGEISATEVTLKTSYESCLNNPFSRYFCRANSPLSL